MKNAEVLQEELDLDKSIEQMFHYRSKLLSVVPSKWIERFKYVYKVLMKELKNGVLKSKDDYLEGNELAINIYNRKYFLKDLNNNLIEKRPEELFVRVAAFVAAVEKDNEKALYWARRFYEELFEGLWLPGGRVLAGAGDLFRLKTLANCFVSIIEDDSIESIYKAAYEAARTYSYGGGIGIDISVLRPAGSVVHNAADSSTGAVSFMELYSLTTGLIGQSGRRGALMLTIDVKHPDVVKFIKVKSTPNWTTNQIVTELSAMGIKGEELEKIKKVVMNNTQVRFANISIKISDEFMHAVVEQNKYGKDKILLYKKLIKGVKKEVIQDIKKVHYSYGMPSKDLSKYELVEVFDDIEGLNDYLSKYYGVVIKEEELKDAQNRDVFGDYVIELKEHAFDLAIRYAGDFLLYFASPEVGSIKHLVKARDIWNLFVESNYRSAEPGLIFWSKTSLYSPSNYIGRKIISTNPCSEVPLEDGGACNLGSLNLSRFVNNPFKENASVDFEKLGRAVETLIRFLDNVVEWNIYLHPLEKQREASRLTRRIGMGVMGIADMFYQLSLDYDGDDALRLLEEVMRFIANKAYETSAFIAEEKGSFELFDYSKYSKNPFFKEAISKEVKDLIKEKGLRNVALLSIAPTGTISNIIKSFEYNGKNYIGVSGGIEPVFALFYLRRSESFGNKMFRVFHSTVQAYLDMFGLSEKANEVGVDELKDLLPPFFFRTAHHIDPIKRVHIQAVAQKYVDHSISSTVNLPVDIEPETISNIYIEAWKAGLKGITIYREGSRYPILSVDRERKEFEIYAEKRFKIKINGKEIIVKGDDVLELPDGRLTTVYHAIKKKLVG